MSAFRVWATDGEDLDDAVTIITEWADDAAREWAENEDRATAEYAIVRQRESPVVAVQRVSDGVITRWKISGEFVPTYYAREVADDE